MKIKGFDKDLKCRGFQFEIGKEYKIDNGDKPLKLCSDTVFHYCNSLQQVHQFYNCSGTANRFCEIEVLGEEVSDEEKCGSNHIRIVREITGAELDELKGYINGNTGLFNSGNRNSGDRNSGDRNSGDRNSGNWNSGMFNSCNFSSGFFCTKEPTVRLFNKDTGMLYSEFLNSKYCKAIKSVGFQLTEWIEYTEEEKKSDKEKEMIGGYLKTYSYKEACRNWWERMPAENREIIQSIPNFDADIFEEITGIRV